MSDADRPGAARVDATPPDAIVAALLDVTGDAVVVIDQAGRYMRASRRARDLLGYDEDELARLLPRAVLGESTDLDGLAREARSLHSDQTLVRHVLLRHKDGRPIPAEVTVRCVQAGRGPFFIVLAREEEREQATASELPSYFAVAVSHELRTPLTTILGSAEALLRAWMRLDNPARRQGVERLLSAARRLNLLVRDLLLVTGIEEGELEVRPAMAPLAPLLEQAIYDASVAHPNLDVRARGLRDAPVVYADPDRVIQVLVHLLDNAARHGQGAGPPEVRVETRAGAAAIRVTDRGPGLPREGRERLFTRFGKLSQASHAGRVGTGLGLYICRQLVERMGGTIGVESAPGKGASFWFTLPLAAREQVKG